MHDKHGDVPLDLDGEGVAHADGAFYVIGSHGRPRNFGQEPDAAAKALIDARTAASSQIVRIRLKPKPGVPLTRSDLRDVRRTSKLTAIIASHLADRLLVDEEIDEDSDAATISEVVERVKATYRSEGDVRAAAAERAAETSEAESLRLRLHLEQRSRLLAKGTCWVLAGGLSCLLFAGTALSLVQLSSGERLGPGALVLAAVLAFAGLVSLLWGFHVNAWRTALEERLARRLKRWLAGGD